MTNVGSEPGESPPEAQDAIPERAAELVTEATETGVTDTGATEIEPARRRRRLKARIAAAGGAAARSSAGAAGRGTRAAGRGTLAARRGMIWGTGWLAGQVLSMAPRLKVRDQAALRAQFPEKSAEDIADALIEGAARAAATVGGAIGVWAALPVLPAFPAEIATETLALVGIEIKLVAELHEAYGMPAPGNAGERMRAYVAAWTHRRGISLAPGGLIFTAGSPLLRRLERRLAARAGRSVFSLGPLLTGAAAGAILNRRETRRLGQDVRSDLRRRALTGDHGDPAHA
jgi:hypothetical protein